MLERLIKQSVVFAIVCGFSLLIGYGTGAGATEFLYVFTAVVVVAAVIIGLKNHIWVFMVASWPFDVGMPFFPFSIALREIAVVIAILSYMVHRVLSRKAFRIRWHMLDIMLAITCVYWMVTFVRHPVGFLFFQSEEIGGRRYILFALAAMAYWILRRQQGPPKWVSRIPAIIAWSFALIGVLGLLVRVFPSLSNIFGLMYLTVAPDLLLQVTAETTIKRLVELDYAAPMWFYALCAYYRPITLFRPTRWRFWLMLLALIGLLASGYRNRMVEVVGTVVIASWLHQGWRETMKILFVGVLLTFALVLGQGRLYNLPLVAQRTLSFLPGRWDASVAWDVEGSSEVRQKWWRDVTGYKMIQNVWFGDGFGQQKSDFASAYWVRETTEQTIHRTGAYHNGPLSTIRFAGYVGLALLYTQFAIAIAYAIKCLRLARGTVFFPLAIFVAVRLIWKPIHFTFIFGAYNLELPDFIFLFGLLRLLVHVTAEKQTTHHIPQPYPLPALT